MELITGKKGGKLKNMKRLNTCCFIGSCTEDRLSSFEEKRTFLNNTELVIEESIIYLIECFSVTNFLSGMDIGFEQYAAEVVLKKKKDYPQITLEGVLPYETHSVNWTEAQRDKYYSIMEKSDREIMMQCHYTWDCMTKRNLYMINQSKHIVFFNEGAGEVDRLILFSKAKGRNIIVINSEKEFNKGLIKNFLH